MLPDTDMAKEKLSVVYDDMNVAINPPIRKPKPTTVGIPPKILARVRELRIMETEPSYSIIERLLAEHDLKLMQKVVRKRVR